MTPLIHKSRCGEMSHKKGQYKYRNKIRKRNKRNSNNDEDED